MSKHFQYTDHDGGHDEPWDLPSDAELKECQLNTQCALLNNHYGGCRVAPPAEEEVQDPVHSIVHIPGYVHAMYDHSDGSIIKLVFTPSASHPMHHAEPAAIVMQGDEDLDVEDTDGPFWKAVQQWIHMQRVTGYDKTIIGWEE